MIQEIITYIIVAVAAGVTLFNFYKRFRKKRVNKEKPDFKTATMQHNCSDCSAECILRDASSTFIENNGELCQKIEKSTSD